MNEPVVNKYGIKMIPKTEKVRPKNIQGINDESDVIIEAAKRVMKKHKAVLDALAKR